MSSRKKRARKAAPSGDAPATEAVAPTVQAEPELESPPDPEPEADSPLAEASDAETSRDDAESTPDDVESTPETEPSGDGGEASEDAEASIEDTHSFLKGLIEAILYVSDRPLTIKEIARAARTDKKRAGELVEELKQDLEGGGLRIDEVAEGLVFRTNPVYASYVRNFLEQRPVRLSRAQLETLSIIAYRQPMTRPEIDDIRGVDCGPVLKGLLERDLVRILGKKDEPGRPMLYGTTPAFLELFSLSSLRELPTLKEFTELSEDSRRKFEQETGEEAPEGPIEADAPADDPTRRTGRTQRAVLRCRR